MVNVFILVHLTYFVMGKVLIVQLAPIAPTGPNFAQFAIKKENILRSNLRAMFTTNKGW